LFRLFLVMIRLYTLLCLVVFVVGLVRNEIVFGCTHASKFWVSNTWAPAPCVYEAIPAHEGRWNWEDVRDEGGQMNGTKQTKRTRRETKHSHSAPLGAGWGSGRREQGNQSPPLCSCRPPSPPATSTGLVARIARPRATRTARARAQLAAARKRS
jgi:hypothetical protein